MGQARANVAHVSDWGGNILHGLLRINPEFGTDSLAALVDDCGLNVNLATLPRTFRWKFIYCLARLGERIGFRNQALNFLALTEDATALHYAAANGDIGCVEMLVRMR